MRKDEKLSAILITMHKVNTTKGEPFNTVKGEPRNTVKVNPNASWSSLPVDL